MTGLSITRFNGGLFSKKLAGRPEYKGSAQELLNFIPTVQGYLDRRGGTRFIYNVQGDDNSRLASFVYSKEQSYILLFQDKKVRIYKAGVFVKELATDYATADINRLYFYQTGDLMFICHPAYPMKQITRTGEAEFSIETVEFDEPPYLATNTTNITLRASTSTSESGTDVTITASSSLFSASDVGRYIRMTTVSASDTKYSWLKIKTYTNETTVVATLEGGQVYGSIGTKVWRLSAFGEKTGYPTCCVVHENRLFLGFKKYLFMSVSSDFKNFQLTDANGVVNDKFGASLVMNMEKSSEILWLYSDFQLVVGAESEEYTVKADNYGTAVTPSNVSAKVSSREGSEFIPPLMLDNGVIFVKRFGRQIISFKYDVNSYTYQNAKLTNFAEDVTYGKVWEMALCNGLQPILWIIKENGDLISCTASINEGVVAFAKHDIHGKVISIASVPEEETEVLYLIVKREINGSSVYYMEKLTDGLKEMAGDTKDAVFVDSAVSVTSESKTTHFNGFGHLIGEKLAILADGAVQPDVVVNQDGSIDIDYPAKKVTAGYNYESLFSPAKESLQDIVLELRNKRITECVVKMYSTVGLSIGTSLDNLHQETFRRTSDRMDTAVSLKTQNRKFVINGGWEQDGDLYLAQTQPLPCSILAIYFDLRF